MGFDQCGQRTQRRGAGAHLASRPASTGSARRPRALEVVPRQWKVIQTVRERFSCRRCEANTQSPAQFHVTPRGFAGPSLLAMILFEKFGQHQPLNRQSERYALNALSRRKGM
jgi:transposase